MNLKTKTFSAGLKQNLCGGLSTKQINASLAGRVETRDHSNLNNLEYLKSGHTGFAGIEFGTTAEWNEKKDYCPVEGMLVVYTDYQSYTDENGETIYVPGFKIGDGNTYLIDKPFVGEVDYNGRQLIADFFNPAESYIAGDYVLYSADGFGNKLFRFTKDKSAGAWDSTAVEGPITVGSEFKRLEETLKIDIDADLSLTSTNPVQNKVITSKLDDIKEYVDDSIGSAISRVYKPQGTTTVDTLNSLNVTTEMNGYVYDILSSGTLTKGSVQVTEGDNVAIIWNEDETDWKWDRLSSIVDLSNYATKTYVTEGLNKKIDRLSSTSGEYIYGIANGVDWVYPLQKQADSNGIVQRTGNGNIVVPLTPAANDCAASKQYVNLTIDTKAVAKSAITVGEYAYAVANGVDKVYPIQKQAISDSIVQRTGNGNIVVPLNPAANDCATSKQYVDTYSGKINSISLDGTTLEIDSDKKVDIPISLITIAGSEAVTVNSNSLNVVTRDTEQDITGIKRFSNTVYIGNYNNDYISITNGDLYIRATNSLVLRSGNNNILPYTNNSTDLGSSTSRWKDLYLSGNAKAKTYTATNSTTNVNWGVSSNQYSNMQFERNSAPIFSMSGQAFFPNSDNQRDLGTQELFWRNLYLAQNLSDGTNSITVAEIAAKQDAVKVKRYI